MKDKQIIVALDYASEDDAWALLHQLSSTQCRVKIGKELFTRAGPEFVRKVVAKNFDVFLDLKFHDIPNTVAGACDAAADLGCWMINVHASGGRAMMEAARERLAKRREQPLLIAVTVLTSMDLAAVREVGYTDSPADLVARLARLSQACGMDGVVCSPQEIKIVKQACGDEFLAITPGVRPLTAARDDQTRVATPQAAIAAGANYLVVGRPITRASDPSAALADIASSTRSETSSRF